MTTHAGRCLCGAVSFTVEVAKPTIDACHCGMCRRWGGGPLLAVHAAGPPAFADPRALGVYRSSDWAERCFCTTCGTSVLYRTVDGAHVFVPVGLLDGVDDFAFATEIFTDQQPPYYAFAGERHRMTAAEVMAAFAGEG